MCIAYPGTVIKTANGRATVDCDGNELTVRYGPLDIKPGDNVLVHAGVVIQKLRTDEAREMRELQKMMEESAQ